MSEGTLPRVESVSFESGGCFLRRPTVWWLRNFTITAPTTFHWIFWEINFVTQSWLLVFRWMISSIESLFQNTAPLCWETYEHERAEKLGCWGHTQCEYYLKYNVLHIEESLPIFILLLKEVTLQRWGLGQIKGVETIASLQRHYLQEYSICKQERWKM